MSINETVEWFNGIYDLNKGQNESKMTFYCGITASTEEARKKHNVSQFLGITKCDSQHTALLLKSRMHEAGYDTRFCKDDTNQDSVYCYLYKKIKHQ